MRALINHYQKKQNVILNRAKHYYKNDKEKLRVQARDKHRNLSEEEKNKKREYGKNRYRNMSEEMKQQLKEYQKHYLKAKSLNIIIMNKIICQLSFNCVCYLFSWTLLNPYIYVI